MGYQVVHYGGQSGLGLQRHSEEILYLDATILTFKPVFFVRDPIKFPSLNRSHKRHPQTNLPDANMVSTILSHRSEMSANPFVVLEVSLLVQKYEYR